MFEEKQFLRSADVNGSSLEGGRHYKLHLPSGLPVCSFWSVIVYDNETRLIIHTDQLWPSVHSNSKRLKVSSDGSVNVLFGPVPPGSEGENWVKTIPGKEWHMILRFYEPQDPGFEERWNPGEIEPLK